MRVVFYGGRHFNNVHKLYEAFYKLYRGRGMAEMYVTDDSGAAELLLSYGKAADLDVHVVPAPWLLQGNAAETSRRHTLLSCGPDMVVLLPGKDDVSRMEAIAASAGVPIWDLRELPYIYLGDETQIGEDEMGYEERVF